MTSSAACWALFCTLVEADYSSPERMRVHQIVVDAYAAQHPGDGERQQVQSVGLHLMTLCLLLEHGADPSAGPALHRRMVRRPTFRQLHRTGAGELTLAHVPTDGPVDVVRDAAYEWARAVWATYEPEWETVRQWLRDNGFAA